jgi:hypothetical protein
MKLILHILAKDLRHHKLEIGLYCAIVAAWAWQLAHPSLRTAENVIGLLYTALFVIWFVLVVRAVQGESLVGDREFWPTRPYRAWQLMLAKAAFIALCVHAPLLIAQIWLCTFAGIPFTASLLARLVLLQLMFALCLTLPAAALAAITQSVVQWFLALLSLGLCALALSWLPWPRLTPGLSGADELTGKLAAAIAGVALFAVLLWQYHRRRQWPARVVFVAAAAAVPLCYALSSSSWARNTAYPANAGDSPIDLTLPNTPKHEYLRFEAPAFHSSSFRFPVIASANSPDSVVLVEGTRFHFTANDGWSAASEWQPENITIAGRGGNPGMVFFVPDEIADQIAARRPNVEVELALAMYRLDDPVRVDTSSDRFPVPGVGVCNWTDRSPLSSRADCIAPLRLPDIRVLQADSGNDTCQREAKEEPLPSGHWAMDFEYRGHGEFDPNPIREFYLGFGSQEWNPHFPRIDDPSQTAVAFLCRGTPFTLRVGQMAQRMRVTVPLGDIGTEQKPQADIGMEEDVSPEK